ncbi:hypothetical protein ACFL38_04025 [Candidatus Omnitrophota bacterium]
MKIVKRRVSIWFALIFFSFAILSFASGGLRAQEEVSAPEEELLSLDFENTDIRDVIRVLAAKSGKNMIVGQDVQASITLQIKDITWQT